MWLEILPALVLAGSTGLERELQGSLHELGTTEVPSRSQERALSYFTLGLSTGGLKNPAASTEGGGSCLETAPLSPGGVRQR